MASTLYLPNGSVYQNGNTPAPPDIDEDDDKDFIREFGGRGLHEWSGYVNEEFLNELQGKRGAQYFEQMRRNDPAIGAIVMAFSMLIRSSQASVQAPIHMTKKARDKPGYKKALAFYNEVIEDMDGRFEDVVEDACSSLFHGYSISELVFKYRKGGTESMFDDGRLGIDRIVPRKQTSLEKWQFDEHGRAVGFWHAPRWGVQEVYIPLAKCLHFRTTREGDNPEGYSFIRNSVRSYRQVNVVQYAEGIGAERSLAGLPMVTMPVGATSQKDYERARNLVERARRDEFAGIVLPPAKAPGEDFRWKFDLISSHNVGTGIDTDKIIRRLHSEMLISTLINFLSFGQGGDAGGTYAAGRVQGDFFQVAVSGMLASWEYEINAKISKRLFRLNKFPGVKEYDHPVIKFSPISQRNMEAVRNLVRDMVSVGFLDNVGVDIENWLRGQLDLPPITEEDLKDREEQQEIMSQKAIKHQQELARISVPEATTKQPEQIPGENPTVKGPPGSKPPRDNKNARSSRDKDGPTAGMR